MSIDYYMNTSKDDAVDFNDRVTKIEIKNFTVFNDISFEPSNGINVIIGENGAGKTHLLKLIYVIHSTFRKYEGNYDQTGFEVNISDRFKENFLVDSVSRLASRRQGHSHCEIDARINSVPLNFSFSTKSKQVALQDFNKSKYTKIKPSEALFLSTKDIFSMVDISLLREKFSKEMNIQVEAYNEFLARQLIRKVGSGPTAAKTKNLIDPIEKFMNAKITYDEEKKQFFIKQTGITGSIEISLAAEGHRKIGTLLHLISNGTISGKQVILWDEPEVNMNPAFAKPVANLLEALVKQGNQVFITTHDYFIPKYIEMAREKQKDKSLIKFFSLYRDKKANEIKIESADSLYDLKYNKIMDEFNNVFKNTMKFV